MDARIEDGVRRRRRDLMRKRSIAARSSSKPECVHYFFDCDCPEPGEKA